MMSLFTQSPTTTLLPQRLSPKERLHQLLALERSDIWTVIIFALSIGVVSLIVPVTTQFLVNSVAFTALIQPIVVLSFLVFLGLIGAGILRTLQTYVVEVMQQRLFVRMAYNSVRRLTQAKINNFTDRQGAELMNRFFDVVILQKTLAALLLDGLSVTLQGVVALLLLAFYHPMLLAFDLILVAAIAFTVLSLNKKGQKTAIDESKKKYEVAAFIEEIASHMRTFKTTDSMQFALHKTDVLVSEYVDKRRQHFKVLFKQMVAAHGLQAVAIATLLGLGGILVIKGQLTLGQLVASEIVVAGVVAGLSKLGKYLEHYYDMLASMDKLGSIFDLVPERQDGIAHKENNQPMHVVFKNVTFAHYSHSTALENVSFELHKDLCIVGSDASGKSTLADLLYGFYEPQKGIIEINGLDMRTLALTNLRKEIGLATREEVFHGTVLDNICVGRAGIQADEVTAALKLADLNVEIEALPQGLSTVIGRNAIGLSTSQIARLMIAKAVVTRPKLLIIDELLDGLDEQTQQTICTQLLECTHSFSLLVLTSHASVARHFKNKAMLKEGKFSLEVQA